MKIRTIDHELEVLDEVLKDLRAVLNKWDAKADQKSEPEKSPFERAKEGDAYFYIDGSGDVGWSYEDEGTIDDAFYAIANYCTDRALLEQRALHETLNRLLWRYSEEHGGDKQPWDGITPHYFICRAMREGKIVVSFNGYSSGQGVVYFPNEETAEAAIRDIVEPFLAAHPDFVW